MARSSKRRLRPRTILIWTLLFLAAFLGWQVYRAVTAKPGHAVDYGAKLEELARKEQAGLPEGPDGWPVLLEAIGLEDAARKGLPEWEGPTPIIDYSAIYMERSTPMYDAQFGWDAVEKRALEGMGAAERAGVFEKLDRMAEAPRAVRPVNAPGHLIDILLPELGRCRQLARACGARLWLATKAGDDPKRVRALEEILALGRVTGQQPLLLDHLVAIAIDVLAMNRVRESVMDRPVDAATGRAMLAAIDRRRALPPLPFAMEGERICCLDAIQWTHTDDGRGSGRLIMSSMKTLTGGAIPAGGAGGGLLGTLADYPIFNLLAVAFPSKAATTARANEFYDKVIKYTKMGIKERLASGFQPDSWATSLPKRYVILSVMLPAVGKAVQSRDQHDMEVAGTRLMLAVEIYRAEHGTPPEKLEELVPAVLPALPGDPVSGAGFGYKRLAPGEDPGGRAYLLYSFGADRTDNGGKPAASEHDALVPQRGAGTDYVLNRVGGRKAEGK